MKHAIPSSIGVLLVAGHAFAGVGDLVTLKEPFILTSDKSYTQKQPWTAMADDGSFVVIYARGDMFARRFDRDANPLGNDFKLNPTIQNGEQDEGYVAVDPITGDFAVTWSDRHGNDGFQMGCGGRFFAANGTPYSPEQIINSTWNFSQFEPHCIFTAQGRVITAWTDAGADAAVGVFGKIFDRFGTPLTPELQFNIPQNGTQIDPAVACDRAGNFVIAFVDASGLTGQPREIIGRLFDKDGNPTSAQFLVNSSSIGMQRECEVAMDADGDFVVVWQDESATDGSGFGVFGRMFDRLGNAKGPQFMLSENGAGEQRDPQVVMDYVGNFVCSWEDNSGGTYDAKMRRFDRFGNPLGSEITLNTNLLTDQTYVRVSLNQSGQRMLASWADNASGDGGDAIGRLFELQILEAVPALAVGQPSQLKLELPGLGNQQYLLLASLGTSPGIQVGYDRVLHLSYDVFFQFLLAFPNSPLGTGFAGTLDANGRATATLALPNDPILHGLTLNFAPLTLDAQSVTGVGGLYDPIAFTIP